MHPSEKLLLNRQLRALNERIDESIEAVDKKAEEFGMKPEEMMYTDGKHVLAPLLLAKAECLSATVRLNIKEG